MPEDNFSKLKHGINAQNSLNELLNSFKTQGYIKEFQVNYRIDQEGYDEKQFYVPFLITFLDEDQWGIFSTTTFRSDRFKGQLWDAYNIKEINKSIKKCYLVYPDVLEKNKDYKDFEIWNTKILSKDIFSPIDGILKTSEMERLIENKKFKNDSLGKVHDAKGRIFESRIADLLSYKENLDKLKNNDGVKTGLNFQKFKKIIHSFNIDPKRIKSINATSKQEDIGLLLSGGQPKTDILVNVIYVDGQKECFTISCKRTNNSYVSVHQYTADKFADVLDSGNINLRILLNEFQRVGGKLSFGEEKSQELTKELKPYLKKLGLWVLGGFLGDCSSETQCAKYFLSYSDQNDDIKIHTVEEYYDLLVSMGINGQFGTVFSWTFASKQKGKSIQLKSKII